MTVQKSLGKTIFWLACRYHILELLLNDFFSSLAIEKSKTPEKEVFKKFKKIGKISCNTLIEVMF